MAVTYRVGGRVPDTMLPRVQDEVPVPIRGRPREAVALLFPDFDSPAWPDYLRGLADQAAELAHWDGRLIAVAPAGHGAAEEGGSAGDTGGSGGDAGGSAGDTGGSAGDTGGSAGDTGGSAAELRDLAAELGDRLWVVRDPKGMLRPGGSGSDDDDPTPAVVVADRFGEIYHVWERGDPEASPGPDPLPLEEWLRFLALQCPE